MSSLLEILKITAPAFMVFLLAVFFFDRMTNQAKSANASSEKIARSKILLPLKISAYERLIVMLERNRPKSLVMRLNRGQMTSGQLHLELLKAIREEYDHNVSLQMYVSDSVWSLVQGARDETLELVKIAAGKLPPDASAMKLSEEIFIIQDKLDKSAIDLALKGLKFEINSEF